MCKPGDFRAQQGSCIQLLPRLDSAIRPGDQPRNGQSHGEGIKAASQRKAARALGSLSRSAAPGEGKEVASGISGQSPQLLNTARHRGRVSLGSGPWPAAQGLSVVRSGLTSRRVSVPACNIATTVHFSWGHHQM